MNIYIPTMGRIKTQRTWDQLTRDQQKRAYLVCPPDEAALHKEQKRQVLACSAKGIANVRQWLVDRAVSLGEKKIVMTDDDHYFYRRVDVSKPALKKCTETDMRIMFAAIESLLDNYPMVGISARQGNDAYLGLRDTAQRSYEIAPGLTINKRTCNMYGVRTDRFHELGVRFDAVQLMEDMHVCLSLIHFGLDVALITEFAWNQESSGVKGGCSAYRNYESQKAAAILLAQLHKPFVTILKKTSKDKSGLNWKSVGTQRFDVRVDWTGAAVVGKNRPQRTLI